ncbi:hypothetical protein, partial [Roseobacter sp.]|uniref:hypothetical protein n=1 Tax=Roseobacter sp. TaxID=1907202 RepID=UPI00385E7C0D
MIRYVALLLFWVLGMPAFAQTVTTRSGEHADFSRLVFRVPVDLDWQVGRNETGYTVSFGAPVAQIDTARAFDLIPRDRVRDLSISSTQDAIDIGVDCPCHANAFLFRPDMLVVDIIDGPAPTQSPFEVPLSQPNGTPELVARQSSGTGDDPQIMPQQSETSQEELRAQPVLPLLFDRPALAVAPPASPTPVPKQDRVQIGFVEDQQDRVDQAAQTLLTQIGRAASQGLLEPALDEIPSASAPVPIQAEPVEELVEIQPENQEPAKAADHVSLRAGSRIDLDIASVFGDRTLRTLDGDACISDAELAVNTWADDKPFPEQIGELRQALVGEFDVISDANVLELAKFYIHFGFGAEAIHIMELATDPIPQAQMLRSMASIVDKGFDPNAGPFLEPLGCDGHAALWAALSLSELSGGNTVNTTAILRGFMALPAHLKRHLGSGLSDKFVALGDTNTARMILRDMDRTPGDQSDRIGLSEARFDAADGQPAQAKAQLEDVIDQNNNVVAAEAIIALVETLTVEDKPIDDQTAVLAGSLAFEYRNDDLGPELARVEVLALAGTGRHAQALDRINNSAFPTVLAQDTRDKVASMMHKNALDADFAALATGPLVGEAENLSRQTSYDISRRLADAGLYEEAKQYYDAIERPDPLEDEVLLNAYLSLAMDDPAQALRYMLGLRTEAADGLRAQAFVAMGEYDRAAPIYAAQGAADQSDLASFRAENWPNLAQSENEDRKAFADL